MKVTNLTANSISQRGLKVGKVTGNQLISRINMWGGKCYVCGNGAEAIDHVKPVHHGGTNHPSNLRPICNKCNMMKLNHWPTWEVHGFLIHKHCCDDYRGRSCVVLLPDGMYRAGIVSGKRIIEWLGASRISYIAPERHCFERTITPEQQKKMQEARKPKELASA